MTTKNKNNLGINHKLNKISVEKLHQAKCGVKLWP